jgi:hypothetical protein
MSHKLVYGHSSSSLVHFSLTICQSKQTMGFPQEDDSDSQNEADDISPSSASSASAVNGHSSQPSAKDAEKEMRNKIIKKEEKYVRNARVILIVVGVACAAAVGAAINIFAHQNDQATFEIEVRKSGRRQNHPCLLASRKRHY